MRTVTVRFPSKCWLCKAPLERGTSAVQIDGDPLGPKGGKQLRCCGCKDKQRPETQQTPPPPPPPEQRQQGRIETERTYRVRPSPVRGDWITHRFDSVDALLKCAGSKGQAWPTTANSEQRESARERNARFADELANGGTNWSDNLSIATLPERMTKPDPELAEAIARLSVQIGERLSLPSRVSREIVRRQEVGDELDADLFRSGELDAWTTTRRVKRPRYIVRMGVNIVTASSEQTRLDLLGGHWAALRATLEGRRYTLLALRHDWLLQRQDVREPHRALVDGFETLGMVIGCRSAHLLCSILRPASGRQQRAPCRIATRRGRFVL